MGGAHVRQMKNAFFFFFLQTWREETMWTS